MRKKLGYFFLALSFLPWGAVVVLPFFDFSAAEIFGYSTSIYLAGQLSFLLSLVLLGREAWLKIKAVISRRRGE